MPTQYPYRVIRAFAVDDKPWFVAVAPSSDPVLLERHGMRVTMHLKERSIDVPLQVIAALVERGNLLAMPAGAPMPEHPAGSVHNPP